jgi:hypothetical protein
MTTPVAGRGWDSDHCLKRGEINDLFDSRFEEFGYPQIYPHNVWIYIMYP